MLTDTQKEIARIESGLYKIEDALHSAVTVQLLMFELGVSELHSAEKALAAATMRGEKALAKARRRLARLKEKMAPVAV